ncbi:MAG: APC family permease [Actinomycetes bacterium]
MSSQAELKELDATAGSVEESKHFQKSFGRREILAFTICTLVGVDSVGQIAHQGPQAITMLLFFSLFFFIPQSLLFAELGTAFPQEGGPYLWARLAFGRLPATINNMLYWVTNPVWFGGTLSVLAATTYETFFMHGKSMGTFWFYLFTITFIWVGTFATVLSFKVGKYIPISGAYARFVILGFFTIAVILYGIKHGIQGIHINQLGINYGGFVTLSGILIFALCGFELPNAAGDEMVDPKRDVPYSLIRAAIAGILLYGIPIVGVLIVLPLGQVTSLGGFIDAIKSVFTVFGGSIASDGTATLTGAGAVLGSIAGLLFILCTLSSGVAWIMGSDRALAVSGYDGAAPRWLGKISAKHGTPVRVNILSGLVATATLIGAHQISGGNLGKYFSVVIGIAISTTVLSYLAIFPALWRLRVTHPDHPRPYKAPFGRTISVWLTCLVLFAGVQLLFPGFGSHWFGENYRPSGWAESEKWKFFLTEGIPLAIFTLIGVIFWISGKSTRAAKAVS